MRVADFELYKDLLYEKSGLVITPDKSYLLDSRLSPVAKKWEFMSIELMTLQLRALPDADLVRDVVEAMTTNETSFFRDMKPFTEFENTILPALMKENAKTKHIRIWCAAASSGQEPYSLAMILKEKEAMLKGWKVEIIATDISEEILEIAKRGIYSQFEVQRGLPVTHLLKYFEQVNEKWRIKDELRNMIKFGYFNLLSDMSRLGTFDLIFCRNVLIYFDEKTKAKTLEKMAARLGKHGFLFLGGAETVLGLTNKFVIMPEKRGLYVLPGSHGTPEPVAAASSPVKTA